MTLDLSGLTEKSTRRGTRYFEDAHGEIVAKECTKCAVVKGLSGFSPSKKCFAGKRSECRGCAAEYNRKYREANPEYHRKYREANPDYYRKYREANPDYYRDYNRKYREDNSEEIKESKRKYREDNSEIFKAIDLRRRARKRLLPDTITGADLTEITLYFDEGCALTGDADVHMDHVLPLSIGHGGTTYENMIPLRTDLNMSKHNRNIFEWFYEEKESFGLSQQKFDELIEYLAEINEMTSKEYRDFVYWCHDNPRTNEEIEADNERYGYMKPSSEIWREEVANKGRELVEA